jgi:hypothetical protein
MPRAALDLSSLRTGETIEIQTASGCIALEVVLQSAGAMFEVGQCHDVRRMVGDEANANLEALDFCS